MKFNPFALIPEIQEQPKEKRAARQPAKWVLDWFAEMDAEEEKHGKPFIRHKPLSDDRPMNRDYGFENALHKSHDLKEWR